MHFNELLKQILETGIFSMFRMTGQGLLHSNTEATICLLRLLTVSVLRAGFMESTKQGLFSGMMIVFRPVPAVYPEGEQQCRDHGELCWQRWSSETNGNSLICSTDCLNPAVNFKRILIFEGNVLKWRFEVTSLAGVRSSFSACYACSSAGLIIDVNLKFRSAGA